MKTNLMKTLAIGLIAFALVLNAGASVKPSKKNNLKSYIENKIKYSLDAKNNFVEGFVVVAFHFNENGTLEIEAINSSDPVLLESVKKQLLDFVWKNEKDFGKTFYYRFDFNLLR